MMGPEQLKHRFDEIRRSLWASRGELEQLLPFLASAVDQKAAMGIMTDLTWACENCTVIGLHQIGQALEDNMGCGS